MAQGGDSSDKLDGAISRPRLRERLREAIRRHNYSRRTEQAYWFWIRWVHSQQWVAASGGDGRGAGGGVSVLAGDGTQRGGGDAESGAVRAALSLQGAAREGSALVQESRAGEAAGAAAGGALARGGAAAARTDGRVEMAHDSVALWRGAEADRVPAVARERRGLRVPANSGARREGCERPGDDASRAGCAAAPGASRAGAGAAPAT